MGTLRLSCLSAGFLSAAHLPLVLCMSSIEGGWKGVFDLKSAETKRDRQERTWGGHGSNSHTNTKRQSAYET